jgi:hypothetical protein
MKICLVISQIENRVHNKLREKKEMIVRSMDMQYLDHNGSKKYCDELRTLIQYMKNITIYCIEISKKNNDGSILQNQGVGADQL